MNNYCIGNNGYAPSGMKGIDGSNGYNVYYSAFPFNDSSNTIKNYIGFNKELSNNNTNTAINIIHYQSNDIIICSDGVIAMIYKKNTAWRFHVIGNINTQVEFNTGCEYNAPVISFKVKSNSYISENNYNYLNETDAHSKSPYFHHRDVYDPSIYGVTICAENGLPLPESVSNAIFVINFNDGLRFEAPFNMDSSVYFIDNRYFYPIGRANNIDMWDTSIFDSSTEKNLNTHPILNASDMCKKFFNGNGTKMCDAYVEYSYTQNYGTYTTSYLYRSKVEFSLEQ